MTLGSVQFQLIDKGPNSDMVFGPVPIIKLGYFWFDYNEFHGDLQYIRFNRQIFIPPNNKITGFGYQMLPGVVGKFTVVYTKLADDPYTVLGNVISAYTGKIPGLAQSLVGGGQGAPPTVTALGTNKRLLKGQY
jgi:hypothetical protein